MQVITSEQSKFSDRWNVSHETIKQLCIYEKLLQKWQPKINLVSPTTMSEIWTRHFSDSLQLLNVAPDAQVWADLGTGAGFPGLVLAICLKERAESPIVHLFESNGKKCAFLREVIRETGCAAQVHDGRIEEQLLQLIEKKSFKIDIVTARALAPLQQLLSYTEQLLTTGTRALFLKGQDVELEIENASKYWVFSPQLHPSQIHTGGCIVDIRGLSRSN